MVAILILLVLHCLLHLPSLCHLFLLRISLLTCPSCHSPSFNAPLLLHPLGMQPCPAGSPHFSCSGISHLPSRTLFFCLKTWHCCYQPQHLLLPRAFKWNKTSLSLLRGCTQSSQGGSVLIAVGAVSSGGEIQQVLSRLLWDCCSKSATITLQPPVYKLPHVLWMVVNRKKWIPSTIAVEVWV